MHTSVYSSSRHSLDLASSSQPRTAPPLLAFGAQDRGSAAVVQCASEVEGPPACYRRTLCAHPCCESEQMVEERPQVHVRLLDGAFLSPVAFYNPIEDKVKR